MSISNSEYLKCGFSFEEAGGKELTMGGEAILKAEKFGYLDLIIEEKGDIDKDIDQCIRVG